MYVTIFINKTAYKINYKTIFYRKKIKRIAVYRLFRTILTTLQSDFLTNILTTVGTNGGLTFLCNKSSQMTCLKNACFFTSSASLSLDPNLRSGFFRKS